ncbi:MAG: FAD-dependent oxidoreductase, partial [archaeon GB-1867-035]|nr:FAD-dependent oxidoreductase [Candidatus Culexmicrobium profundum]
FEDLIITSMRYLKSLDIKVLTKSRALEVDDEKILVEHNGYVEKINFSSLVFATGSRPFVPPIPGRDLDGVYTLRTIRDGMKIADEARNARNVVIVGAGAIGLEVAEALSKLGLNVTLVEIMPRVLPAILDDDMARILHRRISNTKVNLMLNSRVEEIVGDGRVKEVIVNGDSYPCNFVVMATGVRPNVDLARTAGIAIGRFGGIVTDERMQTSNEQMYAAGDCAETVHLITKKPFLPLLGTVAYDQGKVAGVNAAGGSSYYRGALGSTVLKVFGVEVGFSGLTVNQAVKEGFNVIVGKVKWKTKAEYYPNAKDITVKLVFNADDGRLIGGQIIGEEAVAPRVNMIATAMTCGMNAEDLASVDTCYSPPVADTIEPIVRAAEVALRKFKK